ncbi:GNAT family N-acetyltransferase [Paenibacillus gansuensis]|uniref:GNAT family N-acetyltransferase n=1 Tax=Paenibacillus gansuensis TaxID=306542 RepID=A0ABW5PGD0_9BACL
MISRSKLSFPSGAGHQNGDWQLLPLKTRDFQIISVWTREWMDPLNPHVYELTKFSCPGYTDYIKMQQSSLVPETILLALYAGNDIAAFAEYSLDEEKLFVNNFAVDARFRNRGAGRAMLDALEHIAQDQGRPAVELDCFVWNDAVLHMYLKRGYLVTSTSYWLTGPNPAAAFLPSEACAVYESASSEDCHNRYGFSTLRLKVNGADQAVFRLHERYFRIVSGDNPLSPGLLRALYSIDPGRELFVISKQPELAGNPSFQLVSASVRMRLSLS